ncbi:MAG: bifunctional precorrin-2 dehydrogenase/sirohydrochlorin ferrochelatase [Magnetococcales bacterium]|nr:bifunctional precorrin-2 dehydrogenase/sirohydrochlorin ferrochelatase [Magnetococcales bacterium]
MTHSYMAELALEGRLVWLIGAGKVANRKLDGLLPCGARVVVFAPQAHGRIAELAATGQIVHHQQPFDLVLLEQTPRPWLVFAATDDGPFNRAIAQACSHLGLLCNSADDAEVSGFRVPAVVRQGAVTVAVASSGLSPALSRLLKERIENWLESGWHSLAAVFGTMRPLVQQQLADPLLRQRFWRHMAQQAATEQRYRYQDNQPWFKQRMEQFLKSSKSSSTE